MQPCQTVMHLSIGKKMHKPCLEASGKTHTSQGQQDKKEGKTSVEPPFAGIPDKPLKGMPQICRSIKADTTQKVIKKGQA